MGPGAYARVAEIMSGRAISQQGLTATYKDPAFEGEPEGWGGIWSGAWARRSDEGGVTPSEATGEVAPTSGNTRPGQRSPGHSVATDEEHGRTWPFRPKSLGAKMLWSSLRCGGSETGKPQRRGVYACQRLSFRLCGQACPLINVVQNRGQNRTRETRPSGIVGRL